METSTVPDLLNIFRKIVCDRKEYCFVCLRTKEERRLVSPHCFKKFITAAKINANGCNVHYVCHICERQASKALKLIRAAVFASSVGMIVRELSKRDIPNHRIIFEKKYFKRVLNKIKTSAQLTPEYIDEELKSTRKYSVLTETDTLVMDNQQVYESAPAPTVVGLTTTKSEAQDVIIQCPVPHALHRSATPTILPDKDAAQETHQFNNSSETYVILDDEDDPLKGSATQNQPPPPLQPIITQALNLNSNLVVTTNPPRLLTFQELMQQPQSDTNFLLHPIFLAENNQLNVPSLSAVIINGSLVFYDTKNKIINQLPLSVNTDVITQNLMSNNEVFIQNCDNFQLPNKNCDLIVLNPNVSCQKEVLEQAQNVLISNNNCPKFTTQGVLNSNNCQTFAPSILNTNNNGLNFPTQPILNLNNNCQNFAPQSILNSNNNGLNYATPSVFNANERLNFEIRNVLNLNVNCQNELPVYPTKKMKVDDAILKNMLSGRKTPSNVLKGKGAIMSDVTISDISSDMDCVASSGSKVIDTRTDWEDKIPMDVISFVDAVDPNADSVLKGKLQHSTASVMLVGDVRSLANEVSDIIDLC